MATTSRTAAARLTSLVVSALLLVGAQLFSVTPKAYAASPGTISGRVLDAANGHPLANVAIADVGSGDPSVLTDANGDYTLTVAAGNHTVSATLTDYVPKNSPRIAVADGANVTGVNFSLQQFSYIQGTVTDLASAGIPGVHVKLYDATTNLVDPTYTVTTGPDGTFALENLVPGSYKVQYDSSDTSFMTRWYWEASSRDQAEVVSLASGGDTDLSVSLVRASSVSGTVTNGSGTPISAAKVTLFRHGVEASTTTATDASGHYRIGSVAAADQYTVRVQAPGYVTTWYGDQQIASNAEQFALLDSSDLMLRPIAMAPGGSITGSMTPGNVAFSYVTASSPAGSYSASVNTSTGTYVLADLAAGTYAVTFSANGYVPQTITGVHVTVGGTATASATLTAVGPISGTTCTVSGTVTDLANAPLADVTVQSISSSNAFTRTGPDGTYSLVVSSLDDRLLYIADGYVKQTIGSSCQMSNPRATVRLSRVVTITGTVTTSAGPLAGATVWVYEASSEGGLVASALTAADGTYTVTNLPEGYYAVSAFKDVLGDTTYPAKFYPSGSSLATATYLDAGEGSMNADVDIALYKSGSISGVVSMSDGSSTLGAQVTVWSAGITKTVVAGADGSYTVGGLPSGRYTVSSSLTAWSSTSISVVLGEGEAATAKNIELGNGVAVSGIVSRSGDVIPGAIVYLRKADGQLDSTTANASGQYVFRGVPQGTYTVGAALDGDVFYLGGVTKPDHATTFSVATAAVPNVDIVIPLSHAVAVSVQLPGGSPAASGVVTATDAYGASAAAVGISAGLATVTLWPGTYTLAASVDGYPSASATYVIGDDPNATTIQLSAGATLTLTPDTGSVPVAAVVREVATGQSTTKGSASLTGLAAGSYVVAYYPLDADGAYCGPLVWYHGTGYVDAERVALTDGGTRDLTVHAQCQASVATHAVTGTVTAPVTLTADRISVDIIDETGTMSAQTRIDDLGRFSFPGLLPGSYTISATDGEQVLLDASLTVTVTTGDVDVTVPMVLGGSVGGRVLDAFGHQVVTTVSLSRPGFGASQYTPTGEFSVGGLETGDYALVIVPAVPYAPITFASVHVTRGALSDIGTLTVQAGGRITGHLPAVYGIGTVTIDAVNASGSVLVTTTGNPGSDYALWGVPAGTTYVRFSGYGLVTTWWTAGDSLATATPVQVVRNAAVAGIDPTLVPVAGPPTTTISGRVTGVDGPMAGVSVWAQDGSTSFDLATTASDGTYMLTVPQGATYTVHASFCFGARGELGCYGQLVETTAPAVVGTTPRTGVDLAFGAAPLSFQAPTPTIIGAAVVGQTLTVDAGAWAPQPDQLVYQWFAGVNPVPGATSTSLVLTDGQVGLPITVQVTGTKTGYVTATVLSAPTADVVAAPVIVAGQPTFSGIPTVGSPLTVTPGTWTPADVALSYSWAVDGVPLSVTGPTYTPVADDLGKTIAVQVTGTTATMTPVSVTVTSAPVVKGSLTAGTVGIDGLQKVGSTLTAVAAGWPTGATLAYQWYRDGTAVAEATSGTYPLTVTDVNALVSVRVTASVAGYADAVGGAVTGWIQPGTMTPGTVTISGTAQVDTTLTASTAGWPTGADLTLQWSRNGVAVPGATSVTYDVVAADADAVLTVTATGTLFGYAPATASASTAKVLPGSLVAGTPSITGTPAIGQTLTAVPGTWASGVTVAYQWQRNGVAIGGATTSTYVATTSDVGAALTVAVTGTKAGYAAATATSAPVSIPAGALVPGTVSVTGSAVVGATLTANPGTWSPTGVAWTYQWFRSGSPVLGATAATYAVSLADVGSTLSVSVTGQLPGYTSATVSSVESSVVPQPAVVAGTPTITGTAAVGATLTANPGTWTPTGVAFSYQWLRAGVAITGATAATYVPLATDAGQTLSVSVTGSRTGYTSATAVSAPTAPVTSARIVPGTVTISGSATVFSTLTAQPGTWTPANVRLSYQWLRDGVALRGETGQTYGISPADLGHTLSVTVTGARFGYGSASATSAPTAPVQAARVVAGSVTISGTPAVGNRLTAQTAGWTPVSVNLSYQWLRDGVAIRGETGRRYTVQTADVGHVLSVSVTGTRFGYVPAPAVSAPTAPIAPARVVAGTVTIVGSATVGSRLTSQVAGWTPTNVDLSYQWYRDGVAVAGATGPSHTVGLAAVGHAFTLVVTGSVPGWTSATATSAATAVVPPAIVTGGSVRLFGRGVNGSTLVGQADNWAPGNVNLTYQWLRDGTVIPGAVRFRYTLTSADVGHRISLAVTGTAPGYLPTTVTSSSLAVR